MVDGGGQRKKKLVINFSYKSSLQVHSSLSSLHTLHTLSLSLSLRLSLCARLFFFLLSICASCQSFSHSHCQKVLAFFLLFSPLFFFLFFIFFGGKRETNLLILPFTPPPPPPHIAPPLSFFHKNRFMILGIP